MSIKIGRNPPNAKENSNDTGHMSELVGEITTRMVGQLAQIHHNIKIDLRVG